MNDESKLVEATESDSKETMKEIFNKWGKYESLRKDAAIIKYFMERMDQKIRQKTIVEHFKYAMSPKTCREHLYRLCKKEILKKDENFSGTYIFSSKPEHYGACSIVDDMSKLISAIVGRDIYDLAVSQLKNKYIDEIKSLRKQLEECNKELQDYTH